MGAAPFPGAQDQKGVMGGGRFAGQWDPTDIRRLIDLPALDKTGALVFIEVRNEKTAYCA